MEVSDCKQAASNNSNTEQVLSQGKDSADELTSESNLVQQDQTRFPKPNTLDIECNAQRSVKSDHIVSDANLKETIL